ncbi:hypothetical protein LTR10_002211 [Elasticomyces elasticus]|nr:hypothetical protein LTR10_002211 [Elasticomyces elasticus]
MQDMQEVRYLWELCEASANPKSPGGTSDAMKRSRNVATAPNIKYDAITWKMSDQILKVKEALSSHPCCSLLDQSLVSTSGSRLEAFRIPTSRFSLLRKPTSTRRTSFGSYTISPPYRTTCYSKAPRTLPFGPRRCRTKRFLSIASSYPYVMHALLSFSANHLAWVHSSTDTRNLYLHHGSIALRGLHEAIGNFSHTNADAVLAASLLLLWQATDWRSWSSLRAGIQSVLSAMQSWKHESLFAEYVAEEDILATAFRQHQRRPSVDPTEKGVILQNAAYALQSLQSTLPGHELELHYINQLLVYIQQLQGLNPARTPDEQFNYLYQLRKWLFWIPVSLLQRQSGQGSALLTLAHFYAVALSLEPLFPDLGSSFCSATALPPLEAIIAVTSQMQTEHMNAASAEIASLMQYPRATAYNYRSRAMQFQQVKQEEQLMQPVLGFDPSALPFGNLSPAFAPSTPHYNVSHPTSAPASYLEVPSNASFSSNTQTWGVPSPSPGLPPQVYTTQEDQMYFGRFVQPLAIWT